MRYKAFTPKQMTALSWWRGESPYHTYDAIICDGAVRSGKTFCTSLSFLLWADHCFHDAAFALCGKTIVSLRRNVVTPLLPCLREAGLSYEYRPSKNQLEIIGENGRNIFYLFGGRDESSAALIQGVTLGGVLFDEAALMPRSFVEQALARCSLPGSRFWFNCNPEHPYHWFYREWICKAAERNALYLHFTMEDNPALTQQVRRRYESLYQGRFYDRFIRGQWVRAEGLVYPGFTQRLLFEKPPDGLGQFYISCDYGTVNPTSMGLWGASDGIWYRLAESYYDSRHEENSGRRRTDEEHYQTLCELAADRNIKAVIVDPSASSFIECIRRHGRFNVLPAKNDVVGGIRRVSDMLRAERLRFSRSCTDTLREFSLYAYPTESGADAQTELPRKEFDHAMDDIRYFVSTVLDIPSSDTLFYAEAVIRKR